MHVLSSVYSFLDSLPAWVNALTGVVSAASAITALTPTPKDDNILAGVVRVLDVLALNVGHGKRAPRKDQG
jgi:hypothetical protein